MIMKPLSLLILIIFSISVKSQPVIPQKGSGNKYFFYCANLYFEVDADKAARITSFKLDNREIMYVNFAKTDMAGSTFWPSPQNAWGWPPPLNLDSKPFQPTIKDNKIVFRGNTDTKTSLRFYKTMAANSADTSIIIDYCIRNEKTSAQNWAPWEITRVLNSGLTVFPIGSGSVSGNMAGRTDKNSGYVWYDQDQTKGQSGDKFFCDGKGWLAHVIDGDMLFIKKFNDVPGGKAAPTEAEIEVYTAPDKSYTELENQGTYASISIKDSVNWRVKWFARKLPASVDVSVGSTSLTNYIEAVLKREAPLTGIATGKTAQIKVYPNPASNVLTIETGLTNNKNVTLRIYDLQGRSIFYSPLIQSRSQINIENVNQGFYIYEIKDGNTTVLKGQISIKH
jgi:hypothetical protein